MLSRNNNKIIYINLEHEKFFFPGEIIKGSVLIVPKNPIKASSIHLVFTGQVTVTLKEKETMTLFRDTKTVIVNAANTLKPTTLDVKQHLFPFEFTVPNEFPLPSSIQFGKLAVVRYTIHAVLNRPMIPDSLCPRTEYPVSLLEYININTVQFLVTQQKVQEIPLSNFRPKFMVSIPRLGFTRGETVLLKITLDHISLLARRVALSIQLVRTVEIRSGRQVFFDLLKWKTRHAVFNEAVLKTINYDLEMDITQHSQISQPQILIPTSTPPSLRFNDRMIRFHYKIRARLGWAEEHQYKLELPIVLGTWPRAAVPIEEDGVQDMIIQEENVEITSVDAMEEQLSRGMTDHHSSARSEAASTSSSVSLASWRSWDSKNKLSRNTSLCTASSAPDPMTTDDNYANKSSSSSCSTIRPSPVSPASADTVPTILLEPIAPTITLHASTDSEHSDEEDMDLLAIVKRKHNRRSAIL
ncbi:hypothetical protein K501DRAFT_329403 [Backusella circina FSU 941]|nr:hypothetical protein K501DRAFT_329403 [Backusella circina FSU 941]